MRLELGVSCVWELGVRVNLCARLENEHPHTRGATSRQRGPRCGTLGAAHAWRPVDPQMQLSDAFHDSHGICLPPYQNTIGKREPSIWAGPSESSFHSYGGWCPVSYGILYGPPRMSWRRDRLRDQAVFSCFGDAAQRKRPIHAHKHAGPLSYTSCQKMCRS